MASRKRRFSSDAEVHAPLHKEWDEASCSICMDHPHNAVLLMCSSHDKGCRSYICDTSYRHSNCLDRYRKLREDVQNDPVNEASGSSRNLAGQNQGQQHDGAVGGEPETLLDEGIRPEVNTDSSPDSLSKLSCPLCRGRVYGFQVMEEARSYLDSKSRCCSRESCSFVGNYRELRRHARRVHPTARPADVDPTRQRAWRRLQDQREYDDIVTAIRSAMPGAVVLGDYVIENGGDRISSERNRAASAGDSDTSRWLSTFFWFQMLGSRNSGSDQQRGGRSRPVSRNRRSNEGPFPRRRHLWGENLLGLQDEQNEEDNEDDNNGRDNQLEVNVVNQTDIVEDPVRRTRRRLTRSRADEDRRR